MKPETMGCSTTSTGSFSKGEQYLMIPPRGVVSLRCRKMPNHSCWWALSCNERILEHIVPDPRATQQLLGLSLGRKAKHPNTKGFYNWANSVIMCWPAKSKPHRILPSNYSKRELLRWASRSTREQTENLSHKIKLNYIPDCPTRQTNTSTSSMTPNNKCVHPFHQGILHPPSSSTYTPI